MSFLTNAMDSNDESLSFNNNPFPYEIKFVDKEINDQLLKDFTGEFGRKMNLLRVFELIF